jgi:hypothetical protein
MKKDKSTDKQPSGLADTRRQEIINSLFQTLEELIAREENGISLSILQKYLLGLKSFDEKFSMSTADPDNFLSISDLESLVQNLTASQAKSVKELAWEKVKLIDQDPLISQKKKEYLEKGIRLRKWVSLPRSIMTLFGQFQFDRVALVPSTDLDKKKLIELKGEKLVFPLDEFLGIDHLPFKISPAAMLEIAHWVQKIPSYAGAATEMRRNTKIDVTENTMRAVANHIGSLVFQADKDQADKYWGLLESGKLTLPPVTDNHVLYIEMDSAMIHVRKKQTGASAELSETSSTEKKSVWTENKLAMVFSSKDFEWWTDKKGQKQHVIGKREYVAYIGNVEEFKKHVLSLAIRNGYGQYTNTILISDGATWIRNLKDEIFPDAQQILDYYHAAENVTKFAKDIFDLNESEYIPWSKNICDLLKESQYDKVVTILSKLPNKLLNKTDINLLQYLQNNKNNIDYKRYRDNGWYIGSGAIESSNKTVLQFRLKQAGMRWNVECGQFIVSLMAKARSDKWDESVVKLIRDLYEIKGSNVNFQFD